MPLPRLRLIRPDGAPATGGAGPDALSSPAPTSAHDEVDRAFRMHAADVAARGLVMLGSAEEADDLVQEVFMRAFRAIGSLTDPAAVRSWLLTIAVREALRRLKKRKLSRLFAGLQDLDFEALADPSASQEIKLQIGSLFRVLDSLPAELRVAWVLRYLENATTETVAAECGWSLSTTKRRIAQAQERVLKAMG